MFNYLKLMWMEGLKEEAEAKLENQKLSRLTT